MGSYTQEQRAARGLIKSTRYMDIEIPSLLLDGLLKLKIFIERSVHTTMSRQQMITMVLRDFSWEEVER